MPVDEVADLLARWQTAGGVWSRSRVLAEGAARLSRLDPEERHVLAYALADQGAPELANRLGSRPGGALEPADVQAVADGLLALDKDRLGDLVTTLQDPEQVRASAYAALRDLPPPAPPDPAAHLPPPPQAAPSQAAPSQADPSQAAPSQAAPSQADPSQAALSGAAPSGADPSQAAPLAPDQPDAGTGSWNLGDLQVHYDEDVIVRGADDGSQRAAGDDSKDVVSRPRPTSAVVTRDPLAEVTSTLETLRTARSAVDRRAALATLEDRDLTTTETTAVLDAVPDGWERRRAAQRLLEAGSLGEVRAATVVARLSRASDRAFVAAAMLEAGLLRPADLAGLLPARTADRLAARRRR